MKKQTKSEKLKPIKMAGWGDLHTRLSVNECPKCGKRLEELDPFGILTLGVCKPCKKFYSLVIADVTYYLAKSFRDKHLIENNNGKKSTHKTK